MYFSVFHSEGAAIFFDKTRKKLPTYKDGGFKGLTDFINSLKMDKLAKV